MLIPLVDSGRGGIHTHLSLLQCYPGAFVCGTETTELDLPVASGKPRAEKGH